MDSDNVGIAGDCGFHADVRDNLVVFGGLVDCRSGLVLKECVFVPIIST